MRAIIIYIWYHSAKRNGLFWEGGFRVLCFELVLWNFPFVCSLPSWSLYPSFPRSVRRVGTWSRLFGRGKTLIGDGCIIAVFVLLRGKVAKGVVSMLSVGNILVVRILKESLRTKGQGRRAILVGAWGFRLLESLKEQINRLAKCQMLLLLNSATRPLGITTQRNGNCCSAGIEWRQIYRCFCMVPICVL